jgi:hypothetical protein
VSERKPEVDVEWERLPKARKGAKLIGSPTYFTGKVCKQGHIAPRRTHNGECKTCQKVSDKVHRNNNKERRNKNFRDWYNTNRDQQLERMKSWQQSNRDWFNAYENDKRKNNTQYRVAKSLRDRIHKAIDRGDKSKQTMLLLGCSIED